MKSAQNRLLAVSDADGKAALSRLYAQSSKAAKLGRSAHAILVFPKIIKAGFVIGGQGGEGVFLVHGRPAGYYKISAVSYGLQPADSHSATRCFS